MYLTSCILPFFFPTSPSLTLFSSSSSTSSCSFAPPSIFQLQIRNCLINRQSQAIKQLQVERPNTTPLPGHNLRDPINSSHHIFGNLLSTHRNPPYLHNTTSSSPQKQQGRPTGLVNLFLPIAVLQIHSHRNLLLLKKLFPQHLRQERNHPFISKKHIIGITEFPLSLKRTVIGLELGNLDDFGDGYVVVLNLLLGSIFVEA
ncbi:hypothetical protein OIU84_001091 [Salix udensis]|uniref:Uncharacterized protein n=1 Tax=Salix udensis TaxID=889485 RepID=A0AAD6K688_9ROSI|nr:hypothetical protein OIU84_001091 [Salix udensis]